MQVVCHNNKYNDDDTVEGLTLNKVYYGVFNYVYYGVFNYAFIDVVQIIDDNGETRHFIFNDFFISIDQWREQQINKLIDER